MMYSRKLRNYIRELIINSIVDEDEDENIDELSSTSSAGGEYETPKAFTKQSHNLIRKKTGYLGGHSNPDLLGYFLIQEPTTRIFREGIENKYYITIKRKLKKMKITKSQLKQLVQEELKQMNEGPEPQWRVTFPKSGSLGSVNYSGQKVVVKARNVIEAIRKASIKIGVPKNQVNFVITKTVEKLQ